MFHRRTVFVVGAGASHKAGLPIGKDLAVRISDLLSIPRDWALIGDKHRTFASALRVYCEERNDFSDYLELSHQIARGLKAVASIDKYVDAHRHDKRIAQIAKPAIVYTILEAERSSLFWDGDASPMASDPLSRLAASWYSYFGEMVVDGIPLEEIGRLFENITVICFNYDRCIDEFLAHWLATVYALDLGTCRQIASRLTIIRPYGQVAPLSAVAFGDTSRISEVFTLSRNINTFTEQISDRQIMSAIKGAISQAQNVIFLGFAFHQQNLELLKPDQPTTIARVLGTGYGISHRDTGVVAKELAHLFDIKRGTGDLPVHVDFRCRCHELFRQYNRSLNSIEE